MPTLPGLSEIDICNMALMEIGRGAMLSSIDDNSQPARIVKLRYPYARDAVLQAYDWNFATARAALAANAQAPAFEYAAAYDLPSEPWCLQVRSVYLGERDMWKVEGRQILTDVGSPLQIVYTARVTDVAKFSPLFIDALVSRVAAAAAVTLSESKSKAQDLWNVYLGKINEARRRDAQEGQPDPMPTNSWVGDRLGNFTAPYADWNPNA